MWKYTLNHLTLMTMTNSGGALALSPLLWSGFASSHSSASFHLQNPNRNSPNRSSCKMLNDSDLFSSPGGSVPLMSSVSLKPPKPWGQLAPQVRLVP